MPPSVRLASSSIRLAPQSTQSAQIIRAPRILARPPVLARQYSSGATSRASIVTASVASASANGNPPTASALRAFSTSAIKMAATGTNVPLFGLREKQPSDGERQLVEDILKLYQLQPSSAIYARYSPQATFHDPIGLANGLESIKGQFNGMASAFKKSDTVGLKYLDNPEVKPPSVQFSLSQNYTIGSTEKLINSKITLHVDPATNLIKLHEEEWDGKPNTTGEDGFFGKLNEIRKKVTATVVKAAVDTTPPDEKK